MTRKDQSNRKIGSQTTMREGPCVSLSQILGYVALLGRIGYPRDIGQPPRRVWHWPDSHQPPKRLTLFWGWCRFGTFPEVVWCVAALTERPMPTAEHVERMIFQLFKRKLQRA